MTPRPPADGDGDGENPGLVLPGFVPPPQDRTRPAGQAGPDLPTTGRSGASLPQMDPAAVRSTTFREAVFAVATGRSVAGASSGNLRAQLIAAYGPSPRDPSRPNTAEAAKRLGVSQRSVQRWVKGQGISPRHAATVQRTARQAMTTRRGRERAVRAARAAGSAGVPRGLSPGLRIGGVQGVQSSILDNYRDRETNVGMRDEDLRALQEVWVTHGEKGAAAWLHQHMDRHYEQGWHMTSVDEIQWGSSRNYHD